MIAICASQPAQTCSAGSGVLAQRKRQRAQGHQNRPGHLGQAGLGRLCGNEGRPCAAAEGRRALPVERSISEAASDATCGDGASL